MLIEALAEMAAASDADSAAAGVVEALLSAATRLGVDATGVTVVDPPDPERSSAVTDERLHPVQTACAGPGGPGPAAMTSQAHVCVEAPDDRWPEFGDALDGAGYRQAIVLPLRGRTGGLGILGLYRAVPRPFGNGDLDTAQGLADAAAVMLLQAKALDQARRLAGQLQTALTSRIDIEQAKGYLHGVTGVSLEQAFAGMRQYARNHNAKLHAVARAVTSGVLSPEDVGLSRT